MNTKTAFIFLAGLIAGQLSTNAHIEEDHGLLSLSEYRKEKERTILMVPDVMGFTTLKCDLHMHTVFSDGLVWPTIRIQEAWQEGLDVIAITDHIEYQPHKKEIPTDHNAPYNTAKAAAELTNIVLIQGSELTRDTPPGHFNAVFTKDASNFIEEKEKGNLELDKRAIRSAVDQGAFIFWNHPGWKATSIDGSYEWIPFVKDICSENLLHGIEVINGFHYHRKAMDWAIEHDLTILGSSDIHNLIAHDYDMEKGVTRSMTLIFAKDRSPEGVRQALEAKRSVAWSTKILVGREKWVRALYDASVKVGDIYKVDNRGTSYAEITNTSDLYFELERDDAKAKGWPDSIKLNPRTTRVLQIKKNNPSSTKYTVTNAFTGGYENLEVDIDL